MKHKTLLFFLAAAAVTALPLAAAGAPKAPPTNPVELSYAIFIPPAHPFAVQAKDWAAEVEKRTNNRVKITLYPGGSLLKGPQVYEGIVTGVADIGLSPCSYNKAVWPGMMALDQGIISPLNADQSTHLANEFAKELAEKYKAKELQSMHILYFFSTGSALLVSNKPVYALDELKGLQVRGAGAALSMLKALGATPVSIPMPETTLALQKGTIDGGFVSAEVLKSMKMADVVKYIVDLPLKRTAFWVGMNLDKWNTLPPDIQKIMGEVSQEWIDRVGAYTMKGETAGLDYAKQVGVEFIKWSPEEYAKAAELIKPLLGPYIADAEAAGLPARELVDAVVRLAEKYAK